MSGPVTARGKLRLLSTLAFQGLLEELDAREQFIAHHCSEVTWAPTATLVRDIRGGVRGDVGLLTSTAVDELTLSGIVLAGSRVDLAVSQIGLAVRSGADHPDIRTLPSFVTTLREASSICYSKAGASGIHFASLLVRLGLAEVVACKELVIPSGFTGERVARGEAEIAIQQISELKNIPGIDVVGALPDEIQQSTTFSGAILSDGDLEGGRRFLSALACGRLSADYRSQGLHPLSEDRTTGLFGG